MYKEYKHIMTKTVKKKHHLYSQQKVKPKKNIEQNHSLNQKQLIKDYLTFRYYTSKKFITYLMTISHF